MKAHDILVMGELNVDLILDGVQSFPRLGAEVLARERTLALGSSSAIFASNAASLGARVAFLGKLGDDLFGDLVLASLQERDVDTRPIVRSRDLVTGVTVAMNFGETRAMVTHAGAMEHLSGEDLALSLLEGARHLHVSSVFLQPLVKRDILEIFGKAKRLGLTTSLDTQWDPAEKWDLPWRDLWPLVDVFLPNEDELLALTGEKSVDEALARVGPSVSTLVVKRGNQGSRALAGGKAYVAAPFSNPHVVDAIGAGDSFDAGFVVKLLAGAPIERCLLFGNLAGALSTTAAGGTAAFSSPERIRESAWKYFGVNLSDL
jgi:sugar/nucleoside kinase (ribokinase family)